MNKPETFKFPPKVRLVAKKIAEAADTAINAYVRGEVSDEPAITDRWIGAVAGASETAPGRYSRRTTGIFWRAKTLRSSSGRAAEESRHGADLLGVADIHIGDKVVRKGFLGQAKRCEMGEVFDSQRWNQLELQVDQMLTRSAASFVLIYSKQHGIRFVPAISVAGYGRRDLFALNSMSLRDFFELHLACFIGDRRLSAAHIKTLDDLLDLEVLRDYPIKNVLHLMIRSEEPRT